MQSDCVYNVCACKIQSNQEEVTEQVGTSMLIRAAGANLSGSLEVKPCPRAEPLYPAFESGGGVHHGGSLTVFQPVCKQSWWLVLDGGYGGAARALGTILAWRNCACCVLDAGNLQQRSEPG